MHYSSFIPVVALLPMAFAQLNTLAKAKGLKYFGTATDNNELSDAPYVAILSDSTEFGQLTPANSMKWDTVQPSQTTFNYAGGDQIVSLAQKNGQLMRCHNLVWYNQLPSWVSSGSWTAASLTAALQNHITNEVTHWKGQCYAWDVVNEALNDDGTYRTDVFYNVLGANYINIAFQAAAAADTSAKLYYNDYNIETAGAKSTAAQNIVKSLKAAGIKIDGVGLQSHFIVGSTPSTASQLANMKAFEALGVEVAITELDIRFSSLPPSTQGLQQQATDYASTVNACLQAGTSCVGITLWDYTDKYSWVPNTFSGQGEACPWDANLQKKPAYYGIASALGGAATPTSTGPSGPGNPTSTRTTTSPTSPPTGGTVPKWGQCGGQGYTGPTQCAPGSTCTYSNPWYSQCL